MSAPAPETPLKKTPLHSLHRELGAKMVDFGGWEMPGQYQGILEEHRAVRERVGLFDVSHMGEHEDQGPGALAALQTLTPNDVSRLPHGRCQHPAFLTDRGTSVHELPNLYSSWSRRATATRTSTGPFLTEKATSRSRTEAPITR